jgi:formate dehydrogenase subunit delta
MTPPDKLVMMANQIARAFAHEEEERAIACTRDHIVKFWAPAMRGEIRSYLSQGGDKLLPIAREAVRRLPGTAWPLGEDRPTGG